jgi:hypothetical protein
MSKYEFKDIAIWLLVFIVGSLIVSFLIYPNSFQSFKSNIKSIIPSTLSNTNINNPSNVNTNSSSTPIPSNVNTNSAPSTTKEKSIQDISTSSCLSKINERSKVAETKSMINLDIEIEEYKWFNNTQNALDYLKYWGYYNPNIRGYSILCSELTPTEEYISAENRFGWKQKEYNDIIVALVRFKMSTSEGSVKPLYPIICINGELTKTSENQFIVL